MDNEFAEFINHGKLLGHRCLELGYVFREHLAFRKVKNFFR